MALDEARFKLAVGIQRDRRSSNWTRTRSLYGRLCLVLVQLELAAVTGRAPAGQNRHPTTARYPPMLEFDKTTIFER